MSELAANKLLNVEELAALLKVPKSWIYDRTRREAIPLKRLGKYTRFDPDEVSDWVAVGCPANWQESLRAGK